MQITLGELAALVDGELTGRSDLIIRGAAPLADAGPGDITLADGTTKSDLLSASGVAAVVGPPGFAAGDVPVVHVEDVHAAFAQIVSHFRPPRNRAPLGISPMALVSPKARLGADVNVYPYATIEEDVEIGDRVTIHSGVRILAGSRIGADVTILPNVVIYENTVIGPRCILHAGAVIGAYGFGYSQQQGRHVLSAQLGNVVLGADVEVGAGTTIDRGTYGSTTVGDGTKIDNQVMVAHNCRIGKHNLLCSQVGIAGSTSTGDYVVMAGQVGVKDHVHIGNQAVLGAMAGIIGDVPDGEKMVGIPATPYNEQRQKQLALMKLPEMRKQFKKLQATVARLEQHIDAAQRNADDRGEDDDRRAVA